jgi:hypothetical protein
VKPLKPIFIIKMLNKFAIGFSNAIESNIFRFSNISYQVAPRDFEVSKDPAEWEFVQRLLPPQLVPKVPDLKEFPSGFKPPRLSPGVY